MMAKSYRPLVVGALLSMSGCASIISGTSQNVAVNSSPQNAVCNVERAGVQVHSGTTPMSFSIDKTRQNLAISCIDAERRQGIGISKSGVEPWVFGNILLGGLIGIVIDLSSGAVNKYDTPVTVNLGDAPPPTPAIKGGKPIS